MSQLSSESATSMLYYHDNDKECLAQAVLVAENNKIDLAEIQRWSMAEGMQEIFLKIKHRLK